jgi:PAS domain S-box-containing protein
LICLLSAFVSLALGVFVLAKNSQSRLNRLFFAMMIGAAYWALGEYHLWSAGNADGLSFWLHASAFWPLVTAVCVYFIITFTGRWPKDQALSWALRALLFLPAVFFSLAGVLTDSFFSVEYIPGTGWVYVPILSSSVYLASGIYMILIMLWATGATMIAWQRAEQEMTRRQNGLVCVGLVCLIVCGALSAMLFPRLGIYLPNLIFVGSMIFAILIVSAIRQYGLFSMSPETVVPEILRTLPEGVILVNPAGKIIVANGAAGKILGVPAEDLPGQAIASFLPAGFCATLRSALLEKGSVTDLEVALARRSCSVGSVSGTQVRDPSGRIAGFVLIIRDISDRKAAELSLKLANEKITILSQMTRHDVGNLLTALSGYLELVREKNTDPGIVAYLASADGVMEKISRHLQFSREYQEIGSHEPAWQPLESLIERGIAAFPHEGIALTVHVDPVEIYTDPLAFKVMYNLFENAVRHGGHVTRFEVSTKTGPDGSLIVVFEDDGKGIRNEEKSRIFDFGYGSHTGIGLSLSRDILLMTGITITETGEPGNGARFEIQVPPAAWRSVRVRTW